ncbi:hypothetical protein T492DRAFT_586859 [Pavlovales sp. CCMP2436]|nr:hypothetical protein T492DRAFT_586859 [Pavlovales sp. CCMP2436]
MSTTRSGLERTGSELKGYFERQGVIGVSSVLSAPTADALLAHINAEQVRARADIDAELTEFEARFGGVNCRGPGRYGNRQDFFLSPSQPEVRTALGEALRSLEPLLRATVGLDATVHECSSLVSDPGSPRQCMHPDTIVLPCPQFPLASMETLVTFFVALQDVEEDMGHTVFLPKTHTPDAHLLWNKPQKQKEAFIGLHKAVESKLGKGDSLAFDSRLLHCGRENTSHKKRVLFYFTLSAQAEWPLPERRHGPLSMLKNEIGAWRISEFLRPADSPSDSAGA